MSVAALLCSGKNFNLATTKHRVIMHLEISDCTGHLDCASIIIDSSAPSRQVS